MMLSLYSALYSVLTGIKLHTSHHKKGENERGGKVMTNDFLRPKSFLLGLKPISLMF